ncbi:hypothetical protein W911_12595 [Hyphomicrobium nitrativorans NL23]|uniref:Uncharacterized protein n=1 Tax=Hyphomicrobium nitrativorans NL23 TaxID=1029756 RepID=V5SDV7_9HYPH|nr:hypothetical protein [Hyphomicrobium nitrativorans]AHB49056.1 hypothetical protein W911_12595 [Hyphomicrobium nitrativorans NL23]
MSLFRIAIVLSLGVAVMPSDRAQQEELYTRAASAAHWTMTFCDRNGRTCEVSAGLWDAFLKKAEFAGKLVYDVALHTAGPEDTSLKAIPASSEGRGTLSPRDLEPDWRGAPQEHGI